MKGIINMIELIFVLTVLFIAFSILFPGFSYKNKWSTAYLLLTSRDIMITIDRMNDLYSHSFSSSLLNSFVNRIIPTNFTNIIWWPETEGTFKNDIYIGCNCTNETIGNLTLWFANLKINSRQINLIPCYTNLDKINLCRPGNNYPDVLLIWGYKNLTDYKNTLKEYLSKENGIVEVMDFEAVDDTQKSIFGIDTTEGNWNDVDYDTILKPSSVANVTYQPYKIFYHGPIPLEARVNGTLARCTTNVTGDFTLWNTNYTFSICDNTKVYFDKDADNALDTGPLGKGSNFILNKTTSPKGLYNFTLNYIDSEKIGVSFQPTYNFTDFCRVQPPKKKIIPVNSEVKVFMHALKNENVRGYCSILNGTFSRTAWIADFSRDGLDKVEDDHRELLLSLILWASNKRSVSMTSSQLKTGFISTYINAFNDDIFEIYKFKLGLGYPY